MDTSVLSGLSAGGIGGVVIAVVFVLYKCCQHKKIRSECCGGKLDVAEEQPHPTTVVVQQTPPPPAPPKERRLSTLEI